MVLLICWPHKTSFVYGDHCPSCLEESAQEALERADIDAHREVDS
jgi:hypothetical protein